MKKKTMVSLFTIQCFTENINFSFKTYLQGSYHYITTSGYFLSCIISIWNICMLSDVCVLNCLWENAMAHFLLMLFQVVFDFKSSGTVSTCERPSFRVNDHMFGKCTAVAKAFPAHETLEGLLAGVDVTVLLEPSFLSKRWATVGTDMRTLTCMK